MKYECNIPFPEIDKDEISICFTGHRPDKLGGYDWNTPKNKAITDSLECVIRYYILSALSKGKKIRFICGGALGIDQMAFEICSKMREQISDKISIVLAMPFEKQDANWVSKIDKDRLRSQRERADKVVLVDTLPEYQPPYIKVPIGEYHISKMTARNAWMVDNSDLVIAIWDGTKGGTSNCVQYAKVSGLVITRINPTPIFEMVNEGSKSIV